VDAERHERDDALRPAPRQLHLGGRAPPLCSRLKALQQAGGSGQARSLTRRPSLQELRAGLPSYEVGLYEQNVLTYLFYTRNALMDRVYFDTSEYGINCWCACGHGACLSRMSRRPCRVPRWPCLCCPPGDDSHRLGRAAGGRTWTRPTWQSPPSLSTLLGAQCAAASTPTAWESATRSF